MINNKKIYGLILLGVFIVIALIGWFKFEAKKNELPFAKPMQVSEKNISEGSPKRIFENSVVLESEDGEIDKIDIYSGNILKANALDKLDFSEFAGLLKTEGVDQGIVIVSNDKQKAIVTYVPNENEIESQSILSTDEYVCDIAEKKCEKSIFLSQSYEGVGDNLKKIWWSKWDSVNNFLYGNIVDDNLGDIAPVYACNTQSKKCSKTKEANDSFIIPAGSFSPSLNSFVVINQHDQVGVETGKNWELLLYANNDLENPLRTYDISVIIDRDENVAYDSVYSVAWSQDEKKIVIGTTRRIFLFDIDSGGLSLSYVVPVDGEGDFYWDSNKLFLSSDAKVIAFIDESDEEVDLPTETVVDDEAELESVSINVLKKIDLENSNKVTEIFRGPGLSWK